MNFKKAFIKMQEDGYKMKRPAWRGFWAWDSINNTILMHTKDGKILDICNSAFSIYAINSILSNDWIEATSENCTLLGGIPTFDFTTAIEWLDAGETLGRQSKEKVQFNKNSLFTLDDIKATDWTFIND